MPKQMIAAIRGSNVSDRGLLMIERSDLDTGVMNGSGHIQCLLLCFSRFFAYTTGRNTWWKLFEVSIN